MKAVTIMWRRLDQEGRDCCRLSETSRGWKAEGVAIFVHEGEPACLRYAFGCDTSWRAVEATVSGWAGGRTVELHIDRAVTGAWRLNGMEQAVPVNVIDLDLGFTPATNILPIRRLALSTGARSEAPAAYLAFPRFRLDLLEQSYWRLDSSRYAYMAPQFGYEGILDVCDAGFITSYPGLWQACAVRS